MAVKKKVKISGEQKAQDAVNADFMTTSEVKPADQYQIPPEVQGAADSAQMSALNFKDEIEMQAYLKMNDAEKAAFVAKKEKMRRMVNPGATQLEMRKAMAEGL